MTLFEQRVFPRYAARCFAPLLLALFLNILRHGLQPRHVLDALRWERLLMPGNDTPLGYHAAPSYDFANG